MQTAVLARGILSVRLSFRHIPVFCPDEWRYDRAVLASEDNHSGFWRGRVDKDIRRGSPLARASKWGTPLSLAKISQIIGHNLETVPNRWYVSINHLSLIGSRIWASDWYQNRWPWMTLNGVTATKFDSFRGQLRKSGWLIIQQQRFSPEK